MNKAFRTKFSRYPSLTPQSRGYPSAKNKSPESGALRLLEIILNSTEPIMISSLGSDRSNP